MKAVRLTPDTPTEVRKRFPEDYEAIVKLPSLGRTITIPWIGKTKGGEQEIKECKMYASPQACFEKTLKGQ